MPDDAFRREPLARSPHPMGNEQRIYHFPNGYGASVVRGDYTYGGSEGFWELAVLALDGTGSHLGGSLTYDTSVTDDVLGWLSPEAVEETLDKIEALPARVMA